MKNKILVSYSSNNSGGDWWLKTKDWKNLEKAGWLVQWIGLENVYKNGYDIYKKGLPVLKGKKGGNWLGAKAQYAHKLFSDIETALKEFEKVTGLSITDEGCNCCGAPHTFWWYLISELKDGKHTTGEYASGNELEAHL